MQGTKGIIITDRPFGNNLTQIFRILYYQRLIHRLGRHHHLWLLHKSHTSDNEIILRFEHLNTTGQHGSLKTPLPLTMKSLISLLKGLSHPQWQTPSGKCNLSCESVNNWTILSTSMVSQTILHTVGPMIEPSFIQSPLCCQPGVQRPRTKPPDVHSIAEQSITCLIRLLIATH